MTPPARSAADEPVTAGTTRDTAWSFVAYAARALGSLAFVFASSRGLGAQGFGALAGLSSLTSLAVALLVSGYSHAVTQTAAQRLADPSAAVAAAVRAILLLSALTVVPFSFAAALLPGVSVAAAAALFVVDVALTGAMEAASSRFVGERRFARAAAMLGLLAAARLIAASVVLGAGLDTIEAVCLVAAASGVVGALAAIVVYRRGAPSVDAPHVTISTMTRRGLAYCVGNLVKRASNDVDKVYLSAALPADPLVGTYAIAYRLAEYAATPVVAFSAAAYPRLFGAGAIGLASARNAGRALRRRYLLTGVATAMLIVAAAPLAPLVFGDSFVDLTPVLLVMAPLPIVRAWGNSLAEPLTGAGRHSLRVRIWGFGLVANVVLNVALVPSFGINGAVVASYGTELAQIAAVLLFWRSVRASGDVSAAPASSRATR